MSRSSIAIFAAVIAGVCVLHAQEANPITTNMKQSWTNVNALIGKMAARMPEEDYRFKPTADVQDFGQRMAHIIGADMRTCAQLKGDQKSVTFSPAPTKAEVVAAAKETTDECDALFSGLNDAEITKVFAGGRGGPRPKMAIIEGMLEHSQEMYGYMAVYLRLKGLVPPSSDRNER